MRFATRNTWVSTAIAALLNTTDSITLAVLRPTPGSLISSSIVDGTSPPYRSTSIRAAPTSERALLFGNVTLFIYSNTAS